MGIVIVSSDNPIHDVIFVVAQSAVLAPRPPRKEAPAIVSGTSSCPADVFLPTWSRGQPAALDVTVISPLQQQTLSGAANSPGYALNVGIDRKLAAHAASY